MAAELRDALGVGVAEEVARPVRLVLGHQRRALPRDALADPLELERAGRAARGSRRRSRARSTTATPPATAVATAAAASRRPLPASQPAPSTAANGIAGEAVASALPPDPGRADRDERGAAREGPEHVDDRAQLACAARTTRGPRSRPRTRRRSARMRRARASGWKRKSPAGQIPAACAGASGPARLPRAAASVSGEEVGGSSAPDAIIGSMSTANTAARRERPGRRPRSGPSPRTAAIATTASGRHQPDEPARAEHAEQAPRP